MLSCNRRSLPQSLLESTINHPRSEDSRCRWIILIFDTKTAFRRRTFRPGQFSRSHNFSPLRESLLVWHMFNPILVARAFREILLAEGQDGWTMWWTIRWPTRRPQ